MGGKFSKVLDFDTVSLESKKCDKCYENSEIKKYLDDLKKRYNKKFIKIKELSENLKESDYQTIAKINKLKKEIFVTLMTDKTYIQLLRDYTLCSKIKCSKYYKDFYEHVYNSVFIIYQTERMITYEKNNTKKRKLSSKNKLIQEHMILLAKELKINLNDVKKKAYKDTDDLARIFNNKENVTN
jgi:DNA-binding transcriptional MerR regulator